MSSFDPFFNFGPGGTRRFARNAGRSLTGDAVGTIRYPSPFFDIAHTYLPSSFRTMLRWCRYYFITNPLINAVCYKMAEYPVTDLIFDTENEPLLNKWKTFFNKTLKFKKFEVEVGLDYNCFHGDVRAVTSAGPQRLRDLAGKTVSVLSKDGVYRPATFKCYGQQELLEVEFGDGRTVLATPNHEWPVVTPRGDTRKVPTTELKGKRLLRNVAPRPEKDDTFYSGVRHGFTFGDGTLYNGGKQARAYFCGAKDLEMLKFFEGHGSEPTPGDNGVVMVHGLPAHYKQLPSPSQHASYWYGFLCGFLAADGCTDNTGCSVLTQASKATLEAISAQLPRIGMIGAPVRGGWRDTNYGGGDLFYVSLFKQYMKPEDFLLSHHRRNFEENHKPTNYGHHVHVKDVRETGIVDDVFCCEEMETHTFTIEDGILTGNCYGNCFISVFYPFHKYLICKKCDHGIRVEKQKYTFREYKFHGQCGRCGNYGDFKVKDHFIRSQRDIRLIRWNPEQISIRHNESTGENMYYYTVPGALRNDLQMGKRHVIERTPQAFIEAVRKNKALLFNKDNIYHLKRPTIAQKDKGWGLPMILPVLKDTFYLQILRKAQEAIAIEHIVPMRVLFPQMTSGTSDPYATVNLVGWKLKVEQEILRWRLDNNYIPILPIPIGQETLGGAGRALMLSQEYRVWSEHIVSGMGVPSEFIFGGLQYSGSNVSLRMLENHFLDYKADHHALVQDFIMPNVGAFMGWEPIPTRFRKFKMADDLQRSAYNLQLNQAGKLSDHSLLEESDWDSKLERDRIKGEQKTVLENQRSQAVAQAQIQGEAQLVMQKYQIRGQRALEENMPQMEGPLTEPTGEQAQLGMQMGGIPGVASPTAMGQMGNTQQAMAGQMGQVPPMDSRGMLQQAMAEQQAGGMPPGVESPLNAGQSMGVPADQAPPVSMDIRALATKMAAWLDQMSDAERQPHLMALQQSNPQLYPLVAAALQERQGAHLSSAAMPMPQQRAPRRGPEAAVA